jgi:hypothetical protein
MTFPKMLPLAALALAGAVAAAPAKAQNVQAGSLVCDISAGVGMIITSQRQMLCTFTNSRGQREVYGGVIRRFGLDIGATAGGQMVWSVFAPSGQFARGALAGSYVGASGEATVGAGLGANVLLGGSNRSVALQPVSLQGQAGLNVAVGVADLELRVAEPVRQQSRQSGRRRSE